ncbi:hypothetical protein GY45DRAFT_750998 [Cubamyces sp. BRFM 1775]|nr:hypothetical protein GY45DRAFT_750998 [Cubamyces sp. BRFM 1775]
MQWRRYHRVPIRSPVRLSALSTGRPLWLLPRNCSSSCIERNHRTLHHQTLGRMQTYLHCGGSHHRRESLALCLPLSDACRYVWISPSQGVLQRCSPHVQVIVSEPHGGTEALKKYDACTLSMLLEMNGRCDLGVGIYVRTVNIVQ